MLFVAHLANCESVPPQCRIVELCVACIVRCVLTEEAVLRHIGFIQASTLDTLDGGGPFRVGMGILEVLRDLCTEFHVSTSVTRTCGS